MRPSPRAKVTIDNLYEVVCEKSIGTKMNDLGLCLEVVSRSCHCQRTLVKVMSAALHSTLNISVSETVREDSWFQRITNRKWHMGYRMVT